MRPMGVIFGPPGRGHFACLIERLKPTCFAQLLANSAVERFEKRCNGGRKLTHLSSNGRLRFDPPCFFVRRECDPACAFAEPIALAGDRGMSMMQQTTEPNIPSSS